MNFLSHEHIEHYKTVILSAASGILGGGSSLVGVLSNNKTAVFLGNIGLALSIIGFAYSMYTNRKKNKLTDMQIRQAQLEIERMEQERANHQSPDKNFSNN